MSWFTNLFKREISNADVTERIASKTLFDGLNYFDEGKKLYLNGEMEKALSNFDKAIENEFELNFPTNASDLYCLRGGCLQALEYHYDAIEDFNKAIEYDKYDCNKYYSRSISEDAILQYDSEIFDLKLAIVTAQIDNELNRAYNEEAIKMGRKGIKEMFEVSLIIAEMSLNRENKNIEQLNNLSDEEADEFKLVLIKRKVEKLSKIKKRNNKTNKPDIVINIETDTNINNIAGTLYNVAAEAGKKLTATEWVDMLYDIIKDIYPNATKQDVQNIIIRY